MRKASWRTERVDSFSLEVVMHHECQRAYRHRESSLGRWQTAESIKVDFEELVLHMSKLLVDKFDIVIANVGFKELCVVVLPKKMIEAHQPRRKS